jgi:hypothetical protein
MLLNVIEVNGPQFTIQTIPDFNGIKSWRFKVSENNLTTDRFRVSYAHLCIQATSIGWLFIIYPSYAQVMIQTKGAPSRFLLQVEVKDFQFCKFSCDTKNMQFKMKLCLISVP